MTNPLNIMQLVNQAATYKSNHPLAWNAGVAAAEGYYNSLDEFPTNPNQVAACVQFALNERLPALLAAMMRDGSFKGLGFEPTSDALTAMSMAFVIRLDELFQNYVKVGKEVREVYEMLPRSARDV